MLQITPGTTISHYRILETLGRGGQATAFKAEDLRLIRPVVIKALRPELAASETARRRFEREACLCSALDNPHIQGVYDVGEADGLYYIVLQYIEGPTLKQLLAGRPLEPLNALSIGIQIADALAVAHGSGIAHRDLNLALKQGAKQLAPASRQSVAGAINAIVAVLGAVEEHYRKATTAYEHVSHLGDAVALLHVLRDGIEARDESLRRLEAGLVSPSDFKLKPPI